MTNPLVYTPKAKVEAIRTDAGVNTSSLGNRHGDLALAKGMGDLVKAAGAINTHLNEVEDNNNYNKMAFPLIA